MSKNYSKEALSSAVKSEYGSKKASQLFNVPASTVRRHRRNPCLKAQIGRPYYLNATQETFFTSLLALLPDFGFPVTVDVAMKLAKDYFESLGLSDSPGRKWLNSFVKRHIEEIKWQKDAKLERAREEAFTEETRQGWFQTLEAVLRKHDLFDKPNSIFNVDETAFCHQTKGRMVDTEQKNLRFDLGEWVIVKSSRRHVFEKHGGSGKNHRTAVICVNAGGFILSPFYIYRGKNMMNSWRVGGAPGAHYGVTEKGWINTSMFEYWIEFIFIPSTSHLPRPLLLIFDGYSSHVSLKIVNLLKQNTIVCVMLPSHCTHALQPVDIVLFNTVKNDWCKVVKSHFKEGIWPSDNQAMRDKVSTNTVSSLTTSTNARVEPTNILRPQTCSLNISLSSSMNSLMNIHPPSDCSFSTSIFNLTTDDLTTDGNELAAQMTITMIEPAVVYSDVESPLPVRSQIFTDLQPCAIEYLLEEPYRSEFTMSATHENKNATTDGEFVSKPIDAIRHVLQEIFLEREQTNPLTTSAPKPTRDSRLKSVVGLNITEDEHVTMKLKELEVKKKEMEQKQIRKRKSSIEYNSNASKKPANARTKRKSRSVTDKRIDRNKENQLINDPEIQSHVNLLDAALRFTQDVEYNEDSDDDYSMV